MFIDIVIPEGNEQAFVNLAARLGIDGLIFLYDKKGSKRSETKQTPVELELPEGFTATGGRIYSGKETRRAQRDALSFSVGLAPETSQPVFERGSVDAIFGLELERRKDSLHFRNSGFNQVHANLSREKGTMLGISLAEILAVEGLQRAKLLGRQSQNLLVARKYGSPVTLASMARDPWGMRSPVELRALLLSIGASGAQARDIICATGDRLSTIEDAHHGILRTPEITVETG